MGEMIFKKIPVIAGTLLFTILVVIFIQNIGESVPSNSNEENQNSGKAPNFTTTSLDGDIVNLDDYKGKAVLVNFWASWCYPC